MNIFKIVLQTFQDAKRKLRLMLSEADLSPLSLAAPSTGARPKSRKKHQQQSATTEGAAVNGVSGVDKENEVAAFLRVQVRDMQGCMNGLQIFRANISPLVIEMAFSRNP